MRNFIIMLCALVMLSSHFVSCGLIGTQINILPMKKNEILSEGKEIISGLIVKKPFVNKVGKKTGFYEYYFRTSIQDYFIKFCESKLSIDALEKHLEKVPESGPDNDKPVTLEVTIKQGEWDVCDEDFPAQSRVGYFVIVHRIVE